MLLAVILLPPSQDAWAFGGIVRVLQKLTRELTQEFSQETGELAARKYGRMSPAASKGLIAPGVTKLSVQHLEDIKVLFKDSPRLSPPTHLDDYTRFEIPRAVDLRHLAGPIRSQGGEGTCTAFAIAGAMEISIAQKHAHIVKLSERHIWSYYEEPYLHGALIAVTGKWIATSDVWPYENLRPKYSITKSAASIRSRPSWIPVTDSKEALVALSKNKPLVFATEVTRSFNQDMHAIFPHNGLIPINLGGPYEPSLGGHAVTVVGYQFDESFEGGGYFIFRNSWGTDWGAFGYGYLPFGWCKRYFCTAYVLDDVAWEDRTLSVTVVPPGAP
jgi:C1A family cysteine protease